MDFKSIKKCLIKSDSQSAIQAIIASTIKSSLVLLIRDLISTLKLEAEIAIEWVKGHSNITGNELADALAKEGTELALQGCHPILPISSKNVKKDIKNHIDQMWQANWKAEETCKITSSFLPKVDRTRFSQLKGETIVSLKLMVAIITGHGFFGGHLNKLNDKFSPMCNLCQNEIETSYHIYNGCSETAHYKVEENASPGVILRFFSEKFYLRELYKENIKKYSKLNPGREGQGPPDNG